MHPLPACTLAARRKPGRSLGRVGPLAPGACLAITLGPVMPAMRTDDGARRFRQARHHGNGAGPRHAGRPGDDRRTGRRTPEPSAPGLRRGAAKP